MDFIILAALAGAVFLAARRAGASPIKPLVVSFATYVILAMVIPQMASYEPGFGLGAGVATLIIIGLFFALPARSRYAEPAGQPQLAPSPHRSAASVAELVVPRSWGGNEHTDEAVTRLAERTRAAATGANPAGVQSALAAFYRGLQDIPRIDSTVRQRAGDWFDVLARTGDVDDLVGFKLELESGTWGIERAPFKSPAHGRISADRLRDNAVAVISESAAEGHVELPGFGAFSTRPRGGATSLLFHDDSDAPLQLADTDFIEDLAARLGVTPKTATNAATKLFSALRAQVLDNEGSNTWIDVPGLGMFGLRRTGARVRLQFLPGDSPSP
jgi:nucleoid DNA-binding protein